MLPLSQSTPPNQGPVNVPPSPAYPPVMFAPTTDMLTATGFATPQWIFGDSGGNDVTFAGALDPNWGGCNIWISLDDVSYQLLGTLDGPSTIGLTTTPLPGYVGANPDMTDTLTVNLNECDGVLSSVSPTAAAAGHSICVVRDASGFEIFRLYYSYISCTVYVPTSRAFIGTSTALYHGCSMPVASSCMWAHWRISLKRRCRPRMSARRSGSSRRALIRYITVPRISAPLWRMNM